MISRYKTYFSILYLAVFIKTRLPVVRFAAPKILFRVTGALSTNARRPPDDEKSKKKVAKFSLKNFFSKIVYLKKRKSGLVWANSLYTLAAISHARALLFYRMR
jgi:hypothetical protein